MVKNTHRKLTFTKFIQMITEIKNQSDLNDAIAELGKDKARQKQNLAENIGQKMQSLDPANIVKSVVGQVTTKPTLKKSLLFAAAGLASVMVLKKLSGRRSGGKGLLFMALSGVGTMVVNKLLAKKATQPLEN